MKKSFIIFFALICSINFAQKTTKIGYIDMNYILDKVPEYAEAKNQLEQKASTWLTEIETKKTEVKLLKDALATEKILLTKELIADKEEDIATKEKELFDIQQKRFGPQGDLILQKVALAKPIQDQVFNIVQDIAAKRNYDFVFDKSSDLTMLFSAERFDISDFVLKELERAGKKVDLSKKQQRLQDEKDTREFEIKENPEIMAKEKAKDEKAASTKEAREQKIKENKEAYDLKQKEKADAREKMLKEKDEARLKALEERKLKQDEAKKKQEDLKNKNKTEPKKD
jgi:Skp family chaperone for outer membrane proteins